MATEKPIYNFTDRCKFVAYYDDGTTTDGTTDTGVSAVNAEIDIFEAIDDWWGFGLNELKARIGNVKAKKLLVRVNSPGGSVTEGVAIASYLQGLPAQVETSGIGLVASIATIILLAGDKVSMSKGSYFMIHNPTGGMWGGANEMRQVADTLDKMTVSLAQTYADKIRGNGKAITDESGNDVTEQRIMDFMKAETWFAADEAANLGLIDTVTEGARFFNLSGATADYISQNFKNAPAMKKNLLDRFKAFLNLEGDEQPAAETEPTTETVEEVTETAPTDEDITNAKAVLAKAGIVVDAPVEEVTPPADNTEAIEARALVLAKEIVKGLVTEAEASAKETKPVPVNKDTKPPVDLNAEKRTSQFDSLAQQLVKG